MNHIYVYEWQNGTQFVSTGVPEMMVPYHERKGTLKVLGRWRVKKMHSFRLKIVDHERQSFIREHFGLFVQVKEYINGREWPVDHKSHRSEAGKEIIALARKKIGFSDKTADQDILFGFYKIFSKGQ